MSLLSVRCCRGISCIGLVGVQKRLGVENCLEDVTFALTKGVSCRRGLVLSGEVTRSRHGDDMEREANDKVHAPTSLFQVKC